MVKSIGKLSCLWFLGLLAISGAIAQPCPPFPKTEDKRFETDVRVEVGKIGPVRGVELQTKVKSATESVLLKQKNAEYVQLETMMFVAYCWSLQDAKIDPNDRPKLLIQYRTEVRSNLDRLLGGDSDKKTPTLKPSPGATIEPTPSPKTAAQLREEEIREGDLLQSALASGSEDALGRALSSVRNVNARDRRGKTVLFEAVANFNRAAMIQILNAKADPNIPNEDRTTPLTEVATAYNRFSRFQAARNLQSRDRAGVCQAWEIQKLETLETLVSRGANLNAQSNGKWTPLMYAAGNDECPFPELVSRMIQLGADVNAIGTGEYANSFALDLATDSGFQSVVSVLLKNRADPNKRGQFGKTPLINLVEKSNLTADAPDLMGGTCDGRDNAIVMKFRHLVQAGADLTIRDARGESASAILARRAKSGGTPGDRRCIARMMAYVS